MCLKTNIPVQTVPHLSFENATVQCYTPSLASTTIFRKFQTQNQLTNHQPLFCTLNLMRQTLYINMRSRSSLLAERAKHIKDYYHHGNTNIFENVKQQQPANQPSTVASLFAG
jgi:hypothetical protein